MDKLLKLLTEPVMWLMGSACVLHGGVGRFLWNEIGKKTDRSEFISSKEETDRRIAAVEDNFAKVYVQILEVTRQNGENTALISQAIIKIEAVQAQSMEGDKNIKELLQLGRLHRRKNK